MFPLHTRRFCYFEICLRHAVAWAAPYVEPDRHQADHRLELLPCCSRLAIWRNVARIEDDIPKATPREVTSHEFIFLSLQVLDTLHYNKKGDKIETGSDQIEANLEATSLGSQTSTSSEFCVQL